MSVLEEAAASLFSLIGNVTEQDTSIPPDELTKITDLIDNNEGILYKKDYYRSTPLANAIRSGNKHLIKALLEHGASFSIFVEGYLLQSLVCTLPQASQPPSSVFQHDPPLMDTQPEVLDMIDNALVEHVDVLKKNELHEAVDNATKRVSSLTSDLMGEPASRTNGTGGSTTGRDDFEASNKDTTSKSGQSIHPTLFNFFPKKLKEGDMVRRGPQWSYDDQDSFSTGKVKAENGSHVCVLWNYPGSSSYSYRYEPPHCCEVQAVDPNDVMAVPAGQSKPCVVTRKAAFQVGDLVRLFEGIKDTMKPIKESGCLSVTQGRSSKIGIITSIEKKSSIPTSATPGNRSFCSDGTVNIDYTKVRVIDIESQEISDYSSDSLEYADGSQRGSCKKYCGSTLGPFDYGDVVKLSSSYKHSSNRGNFGYCGPQSLGQISDNYTGVVISVPPTNVGANTRYRVERNSNVSDYAESDLRRVLATSSNNQRHRANSDQKFSIGDRVVLCSSYFNSNSDGWNLGSSKDDLKQQPFAFKECWLQPCIAGENHLHHRFKLGDRVSLNTSTWTANSPSTGGKNLGTPSDRRYGIVVSTGSLKDGIQRNIQVVAVGSEVTSNSDSQKNDQEKQQDAQEEARSPLISLYPSYVLEPARASDAFNLDTSDNSIARSHLLAACGEVVRKTGLDIDVNTLCNRFGANVWASLWDIVNSKGFSFDEFIASWEIWFKTRPTIEQKFEVTKEQEIVRNLREYEKNEISKDYDEWKQKIDKVPDKNIDYDVLQWLPDKEMQTQWSCPDCKAHNSLGKGTCMACGHKPGGWICECCRRINKIATTRCNACGCSYKRSKAIRSVNVHNSKVLQIEKEMYSFIENQYELEREQKMGMTENPFNHVMHFGSFTGCGGNPLGLSYCAGPSTDEPGNVMGKCTTEGPNKCRDCGANTHWSCCGSTNKHSTYCIAVPSETTTEAQSQKNARVFAQKCEYDSPVRCKDFCEVKFPGVPSSDWVCLSCSALNLIGTNSCLICQVAQRIGLHGSAGISALQQCSGPGALAGVFPHVCNDNDNSNASSEKVLSLPPLHRRIAQNCAVSYSRMISEYSPVALPSEFDSSQVGFPTQAPITPVTATRDTVRCSAGHPMKEVEKITFGVMCYRCAKELKRGSDAFVCTLCEVHKCLSTCSFFSPGQVWDDDDSDAEDVMTPITNDITNDTTPGAATSVVKQLDEHFELNMNRLKHKESLHDIIESPLSLQSSAGSLGPSLGDDIVSNDMQSLQLGRQNSVGFADLTSYEPITRLDHLVQYRDKALNTAMHHAAFIGLPRFLSELQEYAKSPPLNKSPYVYSAAKIVPQALLDGVATMYPSFMLVDVDHNDHSGDISEEYRNLNSNLPCPMRGVDSLPLYAFDMEATKLYRAVRRRFLGQKNVSAKIIRSIFRTPRDYSWPSDLNELVDAIMDIDQEKSMLLSTQAVNAGISHAHAYKAVALLDSGFGFRSAQVELDLYFAQIENDEINSFDPIAFFAIYSIWKDQNQPFKLMRLCASDTLQCLRCFPKMAEAFITAEDDVDVKVKQEGIDNDNQDNDEDDEDAVVLEIKSDDPEFKWKKAKEDKGMKSPSMDKLMNLTGMKEIKTVAISICLDALNARDRPKHIKAGRSMNFLFVGNPGTGKTTVAELLAAAMVELGFRKNPQPILTSANDILSEQDPADVFNDMIEKAGNGTIFIDEAYHFNPAPKGSTANASNKVLDLLMKVSETKRETLSFILAGYKQEILELMQYNPGFPSRFPRTLEFSDYTESQLQQIMVDFAKQKGMKFQTKRECGVPIAKILARRLAKGAGTKGFGNARDVRNRVDRCVEEQSNRLGTMKLYGKPVSSKDYSILSRADTVGLRPDFDSSPILKELDLMIGLGTVKTALRALMNLQMQNYDNELRGEKVQYISLHRVFMGNAGTGKTTVARLYGRLLKEFGFLSDGDIVEVKPSDLKGQAVGEAAQTTKKIIEMAKGKVLFIDEAYGLDPQRRGGGTGGTFGGDVLDTIVEQIEGSTGQDIAVVMAGYSHEMMEMFKNSGNQGLIRRFNLDDAFHFEDFSDEDLKKVMLYAVRKESLKIEPDTLDAAVKVISQKRRLDGFGNAAEANTALNRAKVRLSQRKANAAANADRRRLAEKSRTEQSVSSTSPTAKSRIGGGALQSINSISNSDPLPTPEECFCDPHLLLSEDFIVEETSAEKAKEAILDLENVEHVMQFILEVEDMLEDAKSQGKSIAEILDTCHMIFTGPPGTGKTTVAQRVGVMFKQLELLPRSDVEMVTASSLMGAFVGHTEQNVQEAMKRAKGGILFIDEAYGLVSGKGTFGAQAIQTLMENITAPNFKGNLVVILAGYADKIEALFDVNPGFRSRFDKKRLEFPSWTAEMATNAIIKKVDKDGLSITDEAKESLPILFRTLSSLPDWGSARDVYETIYTGMYSKRASRVGQLARIKRAEAEKEDKTPLHLNPPTSSVNKSRRELAAEKNKRPAAAAYEAIDVQAAFEDPIKRRSKNQVDSSSILADNDKLKSHVVNISSKEELTALCNSPALTVVCYNLSGGLDQDVSQELGSLSGEYSDVNFALVDGDKMPDLLEEASISKLPSLCLYMDGKNCYRCRPGYDERELRQKIHNFNRLTSKSSQKSDYEAPGNCGDNSGRQVNGKDEDNNNNSDDDLFATEDPSTRNRDKVLTKKVVKHKIFGEDDEGHGRDWTDWTALLEEACGELGYNFEQIEEFLERGNYPEELVALIMLKAGIDDKPAAVEGMNTQRSQLLSKVKLAIKEERRIKSEEEIKLQAKIQSIGRCPAGFAWDKVDGGWRCQGGSHFVDNASVNKVS